MGWNELVQTGDGSAFDEATIPSDERDGVADEEMAVQGGALAPWPGPFHLPIVSPEWAAAIAAELPEDGRVHPLDTHDQLAMTALDGEPARTMLNGWREVAP